MVTGVTGPTTMPANVISGPVANLKDAPVKSDRRSNKPIMEKRRRARINNCLNELKTLILDATKKDPARHSKLEKADILEKTVKHLQELQRQQAVMQQATDPKVMNKFKAGFTNCANEVSRFPGLEPAVKRRLLQHLNNCINGVKTELHQHQRQIAAVQAQQLHAQMLPSPPSSPEQAGEQTHLQQQQHINAATNATATATTVTNPYMLGAQIQQTVNGYFLPNGMQVIPTKLSNGSIALVLPQSLTQQHQQHQQQQQQQQPQQSHIQHHQHLQQQQLQQPQLQQQQLQHQHQHQQSPIQTMSQHPQTTVAINVNATNLMAIPMRTASTSSASSHSSSNYERHLSSPPTAAMHHYAPPSPANSYEAMDYKPSVIQHAPVTLMQQQQLQQHQQHQQQQFQNQQPLSLVIKKNIKEEEQPWRPW